MAEYSITLKFSNNQIPNLMRSGYSLCLAFGMGENTVYNVIAWSGSFSSQVEITWKDQYKIAASKKGFAGGVKFMSGVEPANINSQNVYTLPNDWSNGNISPDNSLDQGAFKFVNSTGGEASAIVYKAVNGRSTPFYISSAAVSARGSETLKPQRKVAVFLERRAESGTMTSKNRGDVSEFDLSYRNDVTASFDGSQFVADS